VNFAGSGGNNQNLVSAFRKLLIVPTLALGVFGGFTPAQASTRISDAEPRGWWTVPAIPLPPKEYAITVVDKPCGAQLFGCALPTGDEIQISSYVASKPDLETAVVAHEAGHEFDFDALTVETRLDFLDIIGHTRWPWWDETERRGGEWFADAYAQCSLRKHLYLPLAYTIGDGLLRGDRLRRACELIAGIL